MKWLRALRCRLGFHAWVGGTDEAARICIDWGGWSNVCSRCPARASGSNRN